MVRTALSLDKSTEDQPSMHCPEECIGILHRIAALLRRLDELEARLH